MTTLPFTHLPHYDRGYANVISTLIIHYSMHFKNDLYNVNGKDYNLNLTVFVICACGLISQYDAVWMICVPLKPLTTTQTFKLSFLKYH